jgi:methyl-accepting chemotaxis protein
MPDAVFDAERSADVLVFPADRARPPSPQTRLARALDSLREALAEQRDAAHTLQGASAQLKTTLAELHARLEGHRDKLARLAADVREVNTAARKLDAWADGALTAEARRR